MSDKKRRDDVKMSDSIRITIRLSKSAAEKIEELVRSGEFKNISEVIRNAIENFLSEKFSPKNIEKISVNLPRSTVNLLLELVDKGDAVDMDDAIRNAVREYVKRRISELAKEEIKRGIKEEIRGDEI